MGDSGSDFKNNIVQPDDQAPLMDGVLRESGNS